MSRTVVTSGKKYIDIDAYGAMVGYAELLKKQGEEAVAVTSGILNESIPPLILELGLPLVADENFKVKPTDSFIMMDTSGSDYMDPIVEIDQIVEIIDHHVSEERAVFWLARLPADKYQNEHVGAVATQVFERWEAAGKLEEMTPGIAKALLAGILDNTLNLEGEITRERDRVAYHWLMEIAGVDESWNQEYFRQCQELIMSDLDAAVINDLSVWDEKWSLGKVFCQLTLWDGEQLVSQIRVACEKLLRPRYGKSWLMNVIDISQQRSYIFSGGDKGTERNMEENCWHGKVKFKDDMAVTLDRAWMRKELFHELEKSLRGKRGDD